MLNIYASGLGHRDQIAGAADWRGLSPTNFTGAKKQGHPRTPEKIGAKFKRHLATLAILGDAMAPEACAARWPQSAGSVPSSLQNSARLPRECERCRPPVRTAS